MHKVLIVDDDRDGRERLRRRMDSEDDFAACKPAATDEQAIREAERSSPELVIVGLALPEASLAQFVGKLKKVVPKAHIFLLTEQSGVFEEKRALAMGVTAVFAKSDDAEALIENARELLDEDAGYSEQQAEISNQPASNRNQQAKRKKAGQSN